VRPRRRVGCWDSWVGGVAGGDWVGAGGACTSAIYIVSTACHVDAVQIFVFPSLCCPTIIGLPKMSTYICTYFFYFGENPKRKQGEIPHAIPIRRQILLLSTSAIYSGNRSLSCSCICIIGSWGSCSTCVMKCVIKREEQVLSILCATFL